MHAIEEMVLADLTKDEDITYEKRNEVHLLPLGAWSREFYEDPRIKQYCKSRHFTVVKFTFRVALERYLTSDYSQEYLDNIEQAILKLISTRSPGSEHGLQNKAAGTYIMNVSRELICQVYQRNDESLTRLFQKYFPTPPARLFGTAPAPDVIQKRDIAVVKTMEKLNLKTLEPAIIKAQRRRRMKNRHQEEVNRVAQRDARHLKFHHMSKEEFAASAEDDSPAQIHQRAEELLQDANTPYRPKCELALAERIMATARKVAAFSTVKHITSASALQNIFDEALYGRRTLIDFYFDFEPAALRDCDILNGDANVICLGPQNIDPSASGEIVIEFDLPHLIKSKPAAFYKQRDLEYRVDEPRKVQLGDAAVWFNHTGYVRWGEPTNTYLIIQDAYERFTQVAWSPKSSFIAYDLERMHEILTLNFFRFMDEMRDLKHKPAQAYIDDFYQKVAQLDDAALLQFLTDLERNMTDTAEFNFYGAHQINFSSIINIHARYQGFTLHLPTFIHALKNGNLNTLRQAREHIPELFQSYRFIDYLLSKVSHSNVQYYLDDLRKECKAPQWVRYTPLSIPEGFELCWDTRAVIRRQQEEIISQEVAPRTDISHLASEAMTLHKQVEIIAREAAHRAEMLRLKTAEVNTLAMNMEQSQKNVKDADIRRKQEEADMKSQEATWRTEELRLASERKTRNIQVDQLLTP